jgi:hypothetical protein
MSGYGSRVQPPFWRNPRLSVSVRMSFRRAAASTGTFVRAEEGLPAWATTTIDDSAIAALRV